MMVFLVSGYCNWRLTKLRIITNQLNKILKTELRSVGLNA